MLQVLTHPPQLYGSICVSTHCPPQLDVGAGQLHVPAEQLIGPSIRASVVGLAMAAFLLVAARMALDWAEL